MLLTWGGAIIAVVSGIWGVESTRRHQSREMTTMGADEETYSARPQGRQQKRPLGWEAVEKWHKEIGVSQI
eukprot:656003-Pyramimonas_sp.AAC.1